jgi:ATP/maltotriose-dependent transcriptional regulator MalT
MLVAGRWERHRRAWSRMTRVSGKAAGPRGHARIAMHRADAPAARRELVHAQRLRPLLTYALPHIAVQARIDLARVHLALADVEGARTLMREVDELLRRRPGLRTLIGEASALRARLTKERGSSLPGMSALTTAELRLLPMLPTHLSFPEIAAEMFPVPQHRQVRGHLDLPKLGVASRSQAVTRSRHLGLLEGRGRAWSAPALPAMANPWAQPAGGWQSARTRSAACSHLSRLSAGPGCRSVRSRARRSGCAICTDTTQPCH